ncbi:stalk domain-containing protein [Paenibacillus ginsengarvi]|nr:stalk domain-containing protein [Paenibacillus ginsengarvi]
MKKVFIGFLVGIISATALSVYADDGLEKIEAYLRPSLPITLDGKKVTLENPPVMYDGSTYLRLRDIAALTGLEVNWNDTTQTVELGKKGDSQMETTLNPSEESQKRALRLYDLRKESEKLTEQISSLYKLIEPYEVLMGSPKLKEKDDFYDKTKKERDVLIKRREEIQEEVNIILKESQAEADQEMERLRSELNKGN